MGGGHRWGHGDTANSLPQQYAPNIHDCDFFLFVFVNYRQRGLILPNAATECAISYVRTRCPSFSYLPPRLSDGVFDGAAAPARDPISVLKQVKPS